MERYEKKIKKSIGRMERGKISKEEYIRKRRRYKEWCKEQKKRQEEEEEEKIRNIKNEAEAWRYINKYRKRKMEGISRYK